MKNFEKLSEFQLTSIKGGRVVTTYDLDGDGNWDVKCIVRNNGTQVWKTR